MFLKIQESVDFERLHLPLMFFVARKKKLLPAPTTLQDFRRNSIPGSMELVYRSFGREAMALLTEYLKENPDQLSGKDHAIIESWKQVVHGDFHVVKQLKPHAVLLDRKNPHIAYGVLGMETSISQTFPHLPAVAEITLFPFRGRIVGCVVNSDFPKVDPSTVKNLDHAYVAAKKRGIITTLSPVAPKSVKKPNPVERVQKLANLLHDKLKEIRNQTLLAKKFESDVKPAFISWLDTHFGEDRKRINDLDAEIEQLRSTFIQANQAWTRGKFDTIDEAIEYARKAAAPNQVNEPEFEAGDEESCQNFSDEFLDQAFAEFMDETRGIDVDDMEAEYYENLRQQFHESVKNARANGKDAFEKALSLIGANDSEENVTAVKKLFRIMARKIHPDRNPDFGEEAQDIWNELTFARDCLDLNTMEKLNLLWRLLQKEEFKPNEENELKEYQRVLNSELEEAKSVVEAYSDHPLWGFTEFKPPRTLKKRLAQEFKEEIEIRIAQRNQLERMLNDLAELPSKKASPIKKKRSKPKKKTVKASPMNKPEMEQATFDF